MNTSSKVVLPQSVTLNSSRALWRFVSRKSNQKTWTSQTGSNHTWMLQFEQSSATQKQQPNVYTTYTPDHTLISYACFTIQTAILFMRVRAQIKIYMVTPTLKNRPLELEIQRMKMNLLANLTDGVSAIFVSTTVCH